MQGNAELLIANYAAFRAERPRMIEAMRSAVASGDARAVNRSAHHFKGAVGNFACTATFNSALALEVMGHRGVLTGASAELVLLESSADCFERALWAFLVTLHPSR